MVSCYVFVLFVHNSMSGVYTVQLHYVIPITSVHYILRNNYCHCYNVFMVAMRSLWVFFLNNRIFTNIYINLLNFVHWEHDCDMNLLYFFCALLKTFLHLTIQNVLSTGTSRIIGTVVVIRSVRFDLNSNNQTYTRLWLSLVLDWKRTFKILIIITLP